MLLWVSRHKSKFLLLGAAVAGGYVGGRWLLSKAAELQERRQSWQMDEEVRLQRHSDNHRQTCLTAVVCLLPRLREAVQAQLNAESVTEELKSKATGKITLWENLKIICFTRAVVGVYVLCAVVTFLRVQLSVLGGELSLHHRDQASGESGLSQQQYLGSVQYLIRRGLAQLVARVRLAAEKVLVSYSLKHQLSSDGVVQVLSDIRSLSASPCTGHAHQSRDQSVQASFVVSFLIPDEQSVKDTDSVASSARDIVESGEFLMVLEQSINQAFSLLSRKIADIHHSAAQSEGTLPVARVIPLITDISNIVFSSSHNSLAQEIIGSPELHKLCRNVFESFSQSGSL